MAKFYKVLKDNFLWSKDAILQFGLSGAGNGYRPIHEDVWDTTKFNDEEYISAKIIENNPDWFEPVYEVNLLSKTVYLGKEEAKKILSDQFTGKGK